MLPVESMLCRGTVLYHMLFIKHILLVLTLMIHVHVVDFNRNGKGKRYMTSCI